jgi:peptidoglycan hydrolase CwlO-like protein
MKNILYILAVVAIGAGAVFGWQVKEKTAKQLDDLGDLKVVTSNLSKSITVKEGEKTVSIDSNKEARSAKDEAVASLETAVGKMGELQKTLDEEASRLEEQQARISEIDKLIAEIKKSVGEDIELEDIPGIVSDLEEKKKSKDKQLSELELVRENLEKSVAKSQAEIARVTTKISESKARVRGNTFSATVTSVNNEWGFLVIAAGEKSGLAGNSKLLLVRDGRHLGNVLISSLEANQAIAEIVPDSMAVGVRPQPGDSVILADTAAN